MKAIILAAGTSSRLNPLTIDTPKCLLDLSNGMTMVELQIKMLKDLGVKDIVVVTGFKGDKISEKLGTSIKYRQYNNYSNTNNLHTLNSVIDELNDDCLVLFADVILSKKLLNKCLTDNSDYSLLIDRNNVTDKTMRVVLKNEKIIDIGSHIPVDKGDGNFIGVAKYSKNAIKTLSKTIIELCKNDDHLNDYYTIALANIAKLGIDINFISNHENLYWAEIDYIKDYNFVKNNFHKIISQLDI